MSQLPTPALSQGVANTGPTPRVNGRYMAHKYGKRVRLQVKIIKNDHGGYTFEATDGVPVEIICNGWDPKGCSEYVEVMGVVVGERTLSADPQRVISWGERFDVNLMNDLIELTFKRQFAEIFGNEHIFESEH